MNFKTALALFAVMPIERQDRVTRIFELIRAAPSFPNVRDAFTQAVQDECYAIETEMLLLATSPTPMVMQ